MLAMLAIHDMATPLKKSKQVQVNANQNAMPANTSQDAGHKSMLANRLWLPQFNASLKATMKIKAHKAI